MRWTTVGEGVTDGQAGGARSRRARPAVRQRTRVLAVAGVSVVLALGTIALAAAGLRPSADGAPVIGEDAAGMPLIPPGGHLSAGQSLDDGGYTLDLQTDGTITAHDPTGNVVWTGGAPGTAGATLEMTLNGDLVERNGTGSVVWHAGTAGSGDCLLGDQTTGTAIVHLAGQTLAWPIWSIGPCYLGDQSTPRTAVVGDSIIFISQPAIDAMLRPRAAYMISGQVGWTIAQQQAAIITDLDNPEGSPSDWIVNLGTNDAIQHNTAWRTAYDAMVADLADQPCVVLTTVSSEADRLGHDTIALQVNAAEEATAATHPNFHVVDWNRLVHEGDHFDRWLVPDHIHPNHTGQRPLAAMYGQALDRSCGS